LTVNRVRVEPEGSSGPLPTFAGEEFIFVMAGRLEIVVGEESYSLATGDSIHCDTEMPRFWANKSGASCTMLWGRVGSLSSTKARIGKEDKEQDR
jgi:quercetin dioxygenase-like cupin family protein